MVEVEGSALQHVLQRLLSGTVDGKLRMNKKFIPISRVGDTKCLSMSSTAQIMLSVGPSVWG